MGFQSWSSCNTVFPEVPAWLSVFWNLWLCVTGGGGVEAAAGAASTASALSTWDALANTLPADIPTQPTMLQGGNLREYQMQVGDRGGVRM